MAKVPTASQAPPPLQTTTGLAGVIAGESKISEVGHKNIGLRYRGYAIEELARYSSFEEVAYLLIHGDLPSPSRLAECELKLAAARKLPVQLLKMLENIPKYSHPMDVLRSSCSFLGCLEPELKPKMQQEDIAYRLIGSYPGILMYWWHFVNSGVRINLDTRAGSFAEHFLMLLKPNGPKPRPEEIESVNASLIIYAEHDFNASTFACRVTTATLSDIYSAVCSAIGTLRGSLHGGANEAAMHMLERFSSIEEADKEESPIMT
eukprot:GHVT01035356.1.p1 GENE.GHVT01035356.1~~GHVT01035356.1.p1  ORF type:complete len:275 (-),score=43.76 GHVT01035356.1:289-1077(-)